MFFSTSSLDLETEFYSISSDVSPHDPAQQTHTLTFKTLPHQSPNTLPTTLKTNIIGRQASASVLTSSGTTTTFTTICHSPARSDDIDFLPLSIEHQERFSAIGSTSGSYNKRDGRPSDSNILTCRLIDRPLRPTIDKGWTRDTQVLWWVLGFDAEGGGSVDVLSILGACAATRLSDVPVAGAVGACEVALLEVDEDEDEDEDKDDPDSSRRRPPDIDNLRAVINPSKAEREQSRIRLIVAGSKDGVLMIEGAASSDDDAESTPSITEAQMTLCVSMAFDAIKVICEGLEELKKVAGKEPRVDLLNVRDPAVKALVDSLFQDDVEQCFAMREGKGPQSNFIDKIYADAETAVKAEIEGAKSSDIKTSVKELMSKTMYDIARERNLRVDGRDFATVRPISVLTGMLPTVHGHALFTRGETQALATATLGDSGMNQKIDSIEGKDQKRFYLQYAFPPSSVGETGRVGTPGRREIGHGALAEKSIQPSIPSESSFPYSIRVESLITESHGSSSMASVCGGSLALCEAGVPVKSMVGGVAMGMLFEEDATPGQKMEDAAIVLTDIMGVEDALGCMDFKVAGDEHGITAFQLDIKCSGLSVGLLSRALEDARVGRLHVLQKMKESVSGPKAELPPNVPKLLTFAIKPSSIGKVIGPGGKTIRGVIEDFDLVNMDVAESGEIQISGYNSTRMSECIAFVEELAGGGGNGGSGGGSGDRAERVEYTGPPPVEGKLYKNCPIKGIHNFGVFVEIMPGLEGMVHVSEVSRCREMRPTRIFVNTDESSQI